MSMPQSDRYGRYDHSRSGRDRYDNYDRSRDRDSANSYRDSDRGRNRPLNHKPPVLKFTNEVDPACFSGPIPFLAANNMPGPGYQSNESYSHESRGQDYDRDYDRDRSSRRSSYGDGESDDRRYHRYRERDRERDRDRDRDRGRDRDRDRERVRDRSRERDHSRDRNSDRSDRERERERNKEREWREEIPNNTIMIRSLDPSVSEADIREEVIRYGFEPKDIRLIREKETGASRGFAFVEFQLLSEAVRWKELTKGVIYCGDRHRGTLHYSIPKDAISERSQFSRADWDCSKCGMSNFRRRDCCFKCNAPREDVADSRYAGTHEISSSPSNTLLFRNLDISTTEERVLAMLGQLTSLPIKSLRVAKDALTNTSRGFAFVELHSTSEATQLHDLLLSMGGNFFVDGRPVTVSYAKRSLSSMNSAASANAAVVALAAAQWTNQQETDSQSPKNWSSTQDGNSESNCSTQETSNLGSVTVNGVTYERHPTPNVSTYQYDESSGFYFDASTGLYYDPNSTYYYDSKQQKYLYWDSTNQTYLPADVSATGTVTSAAPAIGGTNSAPAVAGVSSAPQLSAESSGDAESHDKSKKGKEEKVDKVKIAKKIAKEMERWAKTLNQKKENAKLGIVTAPAAEMMPPPSVFTDISRSSASADAGFAILEKRALSERTAFADVLRPSDSKLGIPGILKEKPVLVASYGDDSDSESEAETVPVASVRRPTKPTGVDESKFVDFNKLVCLLCKRQFPSKDTLTKHQQLSDLHKKNLAKLSSG